MLSTRRFLALVLIGFGIAVRIGQQSKDMLPVEQGSLYTALYRQASAEGMAVIASAGDSGAAACNSAGSTRPVSSGYGVMAMRLYCPR